MKHQVGEPVEVYDPDERRWYAGVIESISAIGNQPAKFYVVKLDEKHDLTDASFTKSRVGEAPLPKLGMLAVPVSHDGWIRARGSST